MNEIDMMVLDNHLLEGQLRLNKNIVVMDNEWDDDKDVFDDPVL